MLVVEKERRGNREAEVDHLLGAPGLDEVEVVGAAAGLGDADIDADRLLQPLVKALGHPYSRGIVRHGRRFAEPDFVIAVQRIGAALDAEVDLAAGRARTGRKGSRYPAFAAGAALGINRKRRGQRRKRNKKRKNTTQIYTYPHSKIYMPFICFCQASRYENDIILLIY